MKPPKPPKPSTLPASLAKLPRFGVGSPELKYMQEWYKPWRKRKHIPPEEGTTAEPPVDLEALRQAAAPVLEGSDDPLKMVGDTLREGGYGGDVKPAVVTYLAVTSRLLRMHAGAMPVHLLLLGAPSAGKSYTIKLVLHLLPRTTYHMIDAGSPRVVIYEKPDLRHRVVVFAEADSLPAGEDNPAASAVRNLLQEHELRYKVVVRDADTGQYVVQEVVRPGPSVLLTTSVRRLGAQMDSRVFDLDAPEDVDHIRAAIKRRSTVHLKGVPEPPPALLAAQAYLQARAPWDVVVPYVERLGDAIGKVMPVPRALRDFQKILSLVQSVAILRHVHRATDEAGRLMATVDDYRAVFDLIGERYEGAVSGATEGVREVVRAVVEIYKHKQDSVAQERQVRKREVAERLKIFDATAGRRIEAAIERGWLIDEQERHGSSRRPARLVPGDDLPDRIGLPLPKDLE